MNWETFSELLDVVVAAGVERSNAAEDIRASRPGFHDLTGEPFAEETGFERRDQAFYEWYLFDYRGGAVISQLRQASDTDVRDAAEALSRHHTLVGSLKILEEDRLALRSWCDNRKYELTVASTAGLSRNEGLIARFFEIDGACYVSSASEVVATPLAKELKRQLKWIADERTTDRDMWSAALRFQLVAHRYASAGPREIVERWITLEDKRAVPEKTDRNDGAEQ